MAQTQIYDLLMDDHRSVEQMFETIEDALDSENYAKAEEVFGQLKIALTAHSKAEEESFYEPLKILARDKEGHDLAWEGAEEHHVAALLLNELSRIDVEEIPWKGKLKVLCELIEHHVEEEENEIFKEAKKYFSAEEAREMGNNFRELKEEYKTMVDEALAEDIEILLHPLAQTNPDKINIISN